MAKGVLCFFYNICYDDEIDIEHDTTAALKSALQTTRPPQPNSELLVFPNPADDRLFVETSNGAGIVSIAICDMQGKIVAAGKDLPLNTGHLRQGVYFINVIDCNGNKYHHKIIKK